MFKPQEICRFKVAGLWLSGEGLRGRRFVNDNVWSSERKQGENVIINIYSIASGKKRRSCWAGGHILAHVLFHALPHSNYLTFYKQMEHDVSVRVGLWLNFLGFGWKRKKMMVMVGEKIFLLHA